MPANPHSRLQGPCLGFPTLTTAPGPAAAPANIAEEGRGCLPRASCGIQRQGPNPSQAGSYFLASQARGGQSNTCAPSALQYPPSTPPVHRPHHLSTFRIAVSTVHIVHRPHCLSTIHTAWPPSALQCPLSTLSTVHIAYPPSTPPVHRLHRSVHRPHRLSTIRIAVSTIHIAVSTVHTACPPSTLLCPLSTPPVQHPHRGVHHLHHSVHRPHRLSTTRIAVSTIHTACPPSALQCPLSTPPTVHTACPPSTPPVRHSHCSVHLLAAPSASGLFGPGQTLNIVLRPHSGFEKQGSPCA